MGIVGLVDGAGEPNDAGGARASRAGTPPHAPDRPWRHPSEVGLGVREETDRRRGLGMVLAFVGVAGAVFLGAAALNAIGSEDAALLESGGVVAPPFAATVHFDTPSGERRAMAMLVEGGTHAIASASDLGDSEEAPYTVRSGSEESAATVVSTDEDTDMTLLELVDPFPEQHPDAAEAHVGDVLLLTHLDHAGNMDTDPVSVKAIETIGAGESDPVTQLMVLDRWTDHHGVLTDSEGRVTGWAFPAEGARMVAYDAGGVLGTAHAMRKQG